MSIGRPIDYFLISFFRVLKAHPMYVNATFFIHEVLHVLPSSFQGLWQIDFSWMYILTGKLRFSYKVIHGKGSGDQLFVTLYSLSIYPSAHKQTRRHLPNSFREFSCSLKVKIASCIIGRVSKEFTLLFSGNVPYQGGVGSTPSS